ncbi:MAG: hypothetical protein ACXVCY_18240 [Pseudobdellovibrionaceae bacterium]
MKKFKKVLLGLTLFSCQLAHAVPRFAINSHAAVETEIDYCKKPYDIMAEGTQARGICICAQLAIDSVKNMGGNRASAVNITSQEYVEGSGDSQTAIYYLEVNDKGLTYLYKVLMHTPPEDDCEVLSIEKNIAE